MTMQVSDCRRLPEALAELSAMQSHGEHGLARMVRTIIRPGAYEGETLLSATQPTTDDARRK